MSLSGPPFLHVRFQHAQGRLTLAVDFALTQTWTVLFGPSGSGKTTVLRTIAGLVRPAGGKIVAFDRRVLLDSGAGIFVPPHQRPVRTAAQGARLFPHMTLRDNVAFGTEWHSKPADTRQIVDEVLDLFDLAGMGDRMPRDLSGGEGQKAAVARAAASAVACGNAILLLDEPFVGLDLRVRGRLLDRLRERLDAWKIPVLSVTHDIAEAFQLDAEVIKLSAGRIVQQGPVATVLAEERAHLLERLSPAE